MPTAGWDSLIENITDPSHVNWSHHGHIGERWAIHPRPCAVYRRDSEMSTLSACPCITCLQPRDSPWLMRSWSMHESSHCREGSHTEITPTQGR